MKITSFVLLFALFWQTCARLNNADDVEQDQRALGNGNGNNGNGNNGNGNGNGNNGNGNGNGNGGGAGAISDPYDAGEFSQFDESRPLVTLPQLALLSITTPPLVSDFAAGNDNDEVDILVTYKNNNGKAKAKGKAKKINQELRLGNIIAMTATKQEIRELALDADIETIDLDSLVLPSASAPLYLKEYFAPDYTSYDYASYGVPFTQSDSTAIPSSTTMGDCNNPSTFKVAIIDTGYMVNHPDSPCLTDANGKTNCIGESFVAEPWDAPVKNSHGTHVMGIIGSLGGSGPYTNVGVMPTRNNICYVTYRVFDESGRGASWSNILAAVDKAVVDQGAKVINMSLGGDAVLGAQDFFNRAYAAGTLTVAASGNDGMVIDKYPASFDDVISVGAINNDKIWAAFYNSYGQYSGGSNCNNNVDVCAPGYKIWSTITKVGSYGSKYGFNDEKSGTSMAAPYVAGVIAKIWSQCPACSHVEVESCLKTTAEYVGPHPMCYGSGLVQAEDAYFCLTKTCCSA